MKILKIENEDYPKKLKNIDNEAYDKQLIGYRKYIQEKTKKPVKCYLYSLLDEKYREVIEN